MGARLTIEQRRAAIEARGRARKERDRVESERKREARERRWAVLRYKRKMPIGTRVRRGLLRLNAAVRALPEIVRAAYVAATPPVRRLILEQHEDAGRRIAGTGTNVEEWVPDSRVEWKTSWGAFKRRANADSPRSAR